MCPALASIWRGACAVLSRKSVAAAHFERRGPAKRRELRHVAWGASAIGGYQRNAVPSTIGRVDRCRLNDGDATPVPTSSRSSSGVGGAALKNRDDIVVRRRKRARTPTPFLTAWALRDDARDVRASVGARGRACGGEWRAKREGY